jgi:hypothetical protein
LKARWLNESAMQLHTALSIKPLGEVRHRATLEGIFPLHDHELICFAVAGTLMKPLRVTSVQTEGCKVKLAIVVLRAARVAKTK